MISIIPPACAGAGSPGGAVSLIDAGWDASGEADARSTSANRGAASSNTVLGVLSNCWRHVYS
jgi:outer membrane receptor protein involved in Fe transport